MVVHCLVSFQPHYLFSHHSFACGTDHILCAAQHNVSKDNAENSDLFFFHSPDDSPKPVPFTSSEPVDNRLPTGQNKQTSQETVSTSKSPGSNQALVRNADCHGGSHVQANQGYRQ